MKSETQKSIIWVLAIALVIACGFAYYFYRAASLIPIMGSGNVAATQAAQAQATALVAKVGQLIVLPQDETPTIATVADPSQLQSQPFFVGAVKGDVVLIYTGAKMAILYDPNINKIINVAPITIGSPSAAPVIPAVPSASSSPTSSLPKKH